MSRTRSNLARLGVLAIRPSFRAFNTSTPRPAFPALRSSEPSVSDNHTTIRTAQQWADFGRDHISHGVGRIRDLVVVKGQGLDVYTADGQKLLDFTAGIGVTNLGHCHPAVTEAAMRQVGELVHMQCSIMFSAPYLQLVERLLPVMPHPSLDQFFFWNSGSEAVEAAIKLARKATGRQNVIAFQGAYHGRTVGSGALTKSKTIYTQGSGPVMPGVFVTPFPYWHGLGVTPSTPEEEIVRLAKHQLDLLLRQQVHPQEVAAIFIEPVQGEGGYVPCPPAFLHHLRDVCDEHGILLVIDEVQTGFFRTGKYFSINRIPDYRPDIMIFAKGVANGFPLSGIVSTKELMGKLDVGSLGGTYAGNAVACAAGVAVQDVFQSEDIGGNVERRAEQLYKGLNALASSSKTRHLIAEVRGQGLMAAIEFRIPGDELTTTDLPSGAEVPNAIGKRVQTYCLEEGLMILTTSCFDTIRFIPALIVTEEQMGKAVEIFSRAVERVAQEG